MKINGKAIFRYAASWVGTLGKGDFLHRENTQEAPLRSELFSAQQMEHHGKTLARRHKVHEGKGGDYLLARLADNGRVIRQSYRLLIKSVEDKRQITPAAEWLLDNFYLIEEQIRLATRHLPKGYSRGLPRLMHGNNAGLPRVYDIAMEAILHCDARIDFENLVGFVTAYQHIAPLKLSELWAIPTMLRLALIENLRRIAFDLTIGRTNRTLADNWADDMIMVADQDPTRLILVVSDMARSNPPMDSSFVAELTRRLQGQGPALALPLTWVEQRLSQTGKTIEQLIHIEIQKQSANQLSISNSIGSLRFLGKTDWRKFVESLSVVDHILHQDPADKYPGMDFETRDQYRHRVEKIAKDSDLSEAEVAQQAIVLAQQAGPSIADHGRFRHVGYYLIGDGRVDLEHATRMRYSLAEKLRGLIRRARLAVYLGAILILTAAISTCFITMSIHDDLAWGWLWSTGFLSVISASHLAVALVNWLATMLAKPSPLPRMDYSAGVPSEARTLVAVPAKLTSLSLADYLAEGLEIRFLANRIPHVHYALLTDFADASSEHQPRENDILQHIQQKIDSLNKKYAHEDGDIFFLFHRPRLWNPHEAVWMGFERKRGKLGDLNRFIRHGLTEAFLLIVGKTALLRQVRYVITLDEDTQLPRDTVYQLIGTMAHPLNVAYYDEDARRVTRGYGILQPRVAANLPGVNASRYANLAGGEPGIDPYTRSVSDVYQDIFREGSFIGKGIYDVNIFERALADRFPVNRILSHDLLEGCYARSGLISDVQLYEEYPSRYRADVNRRHRWIRGDWQIAAWLWPRVPGTHTARQRNPLSFLSRWKIMDNLRRSLVPTALFSLFIIGWAVSSSPYAWTWATLGILLFPSLSVSLFDLMRKSRDLTMRQHLTACLYSAGRHFANTGYSLVILPHEAFYYLDSIMRVLWRMRVTKKHLLQWSRSSEVNHKVGDSLQGSYISMWYVPVASMTIAFLLSAFHPYALMAALPLLALWGFAPAIAWWTSRPTLRKAPSLSSQQLLYLRALARKIWAFFDAYVGPDDNWLPPDNIQEYPVAVTAHRTSPTNIGFALLANLTAYDFGYLTMGRFIENTSRTFETMGKLERYQGHFYNWYDTQTLAPLYPFYVSTVDSGNLAGYLLTLCAGLLALPDEKIIHKRMFEGLKDTLNIIIGITGNVLPEPLHKFQEKLEASCACFPATLSAVKQNLESLAVIAKAFSAHPDTVPETGLSFWVANLTRQCHDLLGDMTALAPWMSITGMENIPALDAIPSLRELAQYVTRLPLVEQQHVHEEEIAKLIAQASALATERIQSLQVLASEAEHMSHMEYGFLYDKESYLLSIGYNVSDHRRDPGYYDLLASEARLGNFIAIAHGKLPQESWFMLGRQLRKAAGKPILLSWSGSMFEYLMPLLVMPTFNRTLLDETYKAVVNRQIEYGKQVNVPWGMSESGYHMFDAHLNYQYRAFGVPGTGLKRGLADDLVVAPYASALALMVMPEEACLNLQRLSQAGYEGKFGLYEAIDYTPKRLPRGKSAAVIQSFMAHHQGMSLLSLSYLLLGQPMQRRFDSQPLMQSAIILLHEKMPKTIPFYTSATEVSETRPSRLTGVGASVRVLTSPNTLVPEVQLLSNGNYHVMLTNGGGSASRWKDLAVTRWRQDTTRDNWGIFTYIKDLDSEEFWSTAYQPTLKPPKSYEVIFSEGRAEYRRRDRDFDTQTEIVVSPEDDIELRRCRITNQSRQRKIIEVTSYAEVVMAPQAADAAHPAFSNLFVQTEILKDRKAIICTRRSRSADERPPWMFHLMAVHGSDTGETSYETDRMKFVGRGETTATPHALFSSLSGTEGSVLDPIVAIRKKITLEPEQSVTIDMIIGAAENREICVGLIDKYQDSNLSDRVFDMAWTHSQVILRQLNASDADAQLYNKLANAIFYPHETFRADAATLIKNRRGQSGLWSYAISGDLPIVLLRVKDMANIELVRQMVQAHAYWRLKGVAVDLFIWNEDQGGYRQSLQDQIMGLIAAGIEAHVMDRPGGIFVRPLDQISPEDRILLEAVARIIITDEAGPLSEQVNRPAVKHPRPPRLVPSQKIRPSRHGLDLPGKDELLLFNGLGGFSPDGREYVIVTREGQKTPAPWSNVLANSDFGTVISESGQAYTWSENAHSLRITPWHNDPVSDQSGEAFYLRDEETGHFWSPTPEPCPGSSAYITRHGFGYSSFEYVENGIYSKLTVYVAIDGPVKFFALKIRNTSGRPRKISVTGYVEWVLGDMRSKTGMHIVTEIDPATGALLAKNAYNTEFPDRTAFFDVDDKFKTLTGNRREFIGRNGSIRHPAAMSRMHLSGKVGAGLDACGAIQVVCDLAEDQEREVTFKLGMAGRLHENAGHLVRHYRGALAAETALEDVHLYWRETLGMVQVETPDLAVNLLANGWLMYQTIACRLWARSGFYQSSGAFGFRDQLQDVMTLVYARPQLTRNHLLLCAAHQFIEGDVLHWWHPPLDRGVRTKCSDDYLWLPLAVHRYVTATGDTGVLDEVVPFIEGRALNPGEDSYYDLPHPSPQTATLYEHCTRAIERGLNFGERGLPLIGSCDWNDGMDKVGEHGKGESVWLGFFLYDILQKFKDIAVIRNDTPFAALCIDEAENLRQNIEKNGWDGAWYRRAYFDDGTPLGSSLNQECQIDSLSQSWAVLSGAADPARARMGMDAVDKRLVRRDSALIQLLDPPFDKAEPNPGYIRGYVPGVRENGGQYTHAAIWTTMAFARMGDRARTWEMLQMINPLNHGRTPEEIATYKVEPYVVAADVYGVAPHAGRGGWTWYTGSSGWMYRLIIESVLGLSLGVDRLRFTPCLPPEWRNFRLKYVYRRTLYIIDVIQEMAESAATTITLDGRIQEEDTILLVDDEQEHQVQVNIQIR